MTTKTLHDVSIEWDQANTEMESRTAGWRSRSPHCRASKARGIMGTQCGSRIDRRWP
jgi:hypothetical protein